MLIKSQWLFVGFLKTKLILRGVVGIENKKNNHALKL
jgi:hypothetical protein